MSTTENKPKTNTEFVTELMDFSPAGPLMHAFVLQAIESYAKAVIERQDEIAEDGMISRRAWVNCAEHSLKAINERGV